MIQLALFPPPARAEQLHLFDPTHQEIRMPTPSTTTPARRGFLRRLLGLRPRWTPPSTTTDLTEADWTVIRAALQRQARDSAREQLWPAHEAAVAVLDKLGRR